MTMKEYLLVIIAAHIVQVIAFCIRTRQKEKLFGVIHHYLMKVDCLEKFFSHAQTILNRSHLTHYQLNFGAVECKESECRLNFYVKLT